MALVLVQWNAVSAMLVVYSNEDWFTSACDEHVLVIVNGDSITCEIDTVPASDILPTLISDVGKSSNESAWRALLEMFLNGSWVTCLAWLEPPFATPTRLVELRSMGSPAEILSFSLR